MDLKVLFTLTTIFAISNAEYKSYKDYKVYAITPNTDKDVKIMEDLQEKDGVSFWTDVIAIGTDVKIMLAPEKQKEFEEYWQTVGINFEVAIEDVQTLIDAQLKRPANMPRSSSEYAWNYYQTLEEIYDWLNDIAQRHSNVVTLVNLGKSVEGRDILGVTIDYKKRENPTIGMIEGGIHSREWIAPATVTWIINELLTSSDDDIRNLAENVVWHIFPVVNPDGYAYTFTNNRMWRKNRSTANNTSCAPWNLDSDMSNGIDLNRNFGFLWLTIGASANPCAETFAGPIQFSEPEAVAIANYVTTIQQQGHLVYYFAFHSFSQMVLVPYSHVSGSGTLAATNYADMYEIAIRGADNLRQRHGTNYAVGTSADILYAVSGSSFDWVKGVANVPIVYLFELRDVGRYGFLLPAELIVPNNEEIMDGLVEMDRVARGMGYYGNSGTSLRITATLFLITLLVFA